MSTGQSIQFVIRNTIDHTLFWSNSAGWVNRDQRDVFSADERFNLNLPIEGEWQQLLILRKPR